MSRRFENPKKQVMTIPISQPRYIPEFYLALLLCLYDKGSIQYADDSAKKLCSDDEFAKWLSNNPRYKKCIRIEKGIEVIARNTDSDLFTPEIFARTKIQVTDKKFLEKLLKEHVQLFEEDKLPMDYDCYGKNIDECVKIWQPKYDARAGIVSIAISSFETPDLRECDTLLSLFFQGDLVKFLSAKRRIQPGCSRERIIQEVVFKVKFLKSPEDIRDDIINPCKFIEYKYLKINENTFEVFYKGVSVKTGERPSPKDFKVMKYLMKHKLPVDIDKVYREVEETKKSLPENNRWGNNRVGAINNFLGMTGATKAIRERKKGYFFSAKGGVFDIILQENKNVKKDVNRKVKKTPGKQKS
ncbi:MAG: hypothetical protein FWG57_09135 [Endomicrobia bacterium]|nr:hypothetical protein [Endomicrobiia bacterium]